MKYLFFLFLLVIFGCTNEKDAHRALNSQGFSDVNITGYQWFVCGKDDFYATGFEAKNPQGQKVYGTVCSGILLKGATIRF